MTEERLSNERLAQIAEFRHPSPANVQELLREINALRDDMKAIIAGNAQGAISARNQIHRLLDAADVTPAPDYMSRIAALIAQRDSLLSPHHHPTDGPGD